MAGKPHHRGARYRQGRRILQAAGRANPAAICWRCGKRLAEHPPHIDGKPQTWQAGHTIDGSTTWQVWPHVTTPPPPGDWLALEASRCNIAAGNDARDARHRTGYSWP